MTHPDGQRLDSFAFAAVSDLALQLEDGTGSCRSSSCRTARRRWSCAGTSSAPARDAVRAPASSRVATTTPSSTRIRRFASCRASRAARALAAGRGLPAVMARTNGRVRADPTWYRNFLYEEELAARARPRRGPRRARDASSYDLRHGRGRPGAGRRGADDDRARGERRRRRTAAPAPRELERRGRPLAAGSRRRRLPGTARDGRTIIAGYPWFTDWGRDTLPRLARTLLAHGVVEQALEILLAWARTSRTACCPTASPITASGPTSTRSTPRCGSSSRSSCSPRRAQATRAPAAGDAPL